MKDPPEPGVLFPSLRTADRRDDEDAGDDAIFQSVASSLTQYNR